MLLPCPLLSLQPNSRLLINYGIVDEANPHDRLPLAGALAALPAPQRCACIAVVLLVCPLHPAGWPFHQLPHRFRSFLPLPCPTVTIPSDDPLYRQKRDKLAEHDLSTQQARRAQRSVRFARRRARPPARPTGGSFLLDAPLPPCAPRSADLPAAAGDPAAAAAAAVPAVGVCYEPC